VDERDALVPADHEGGGKAGRWYSAIRLTVTGTRIGDSALIATTAMQWSATATVAAPLTAPLTFSGSGAVSRRQSYSSGAMLMLRVPHHCAAPMESAHFNQVAALSVCAG
jgi:hypothetical protein